MKIRNGFVSNSSSSSFIIYGNDVECEKDLEALLRLNEKELDAEAKEYYRGCGHHSSKAFQYLYKKFKKVKSNPIITKDDQYWNLEERKVYEVNFDKFIDRLYDKDSWIYKVIKENVTSSIYDSRIEFKDTCSSKKEEFSRFDSFVNLYEVVKDLRKELTDNCTKIGIDSIKHELNSLRKDFGKNAKIYFISFSTDDGKPEPFDSFFRSGIPFKNADKIRDERS